MLEYISEKEILEEQINLYKQQQLRDETEIKRLKQKILDLKEIIISIIDKS
mgnify:FL=1|tara:strand:+ start:35 stop:187 length:153 start_codon:yes stop_codon:yes gene_type:complete